LKKGACLFLKKVGRKKGEKFRNLEKVVEKIRKKSLEKACFRN